MKHCIRSALVLCAAGCGGSQSGRTSSEYEQIDVIPVQVTNEDQQAVLAEQERLERRENGEQTQTTAAGPALVTFVVKVGNDDAQASLELKDPNGDTVLSPAPGSQVSLRPGPYTLVASVTDADVLADTPKREEEVTVSSGEPQTIEVRFPTSHVRLRVRKAGRPVRNANITLFEARSQEEVGAFRATDHHITVTPGRYEADIQVGQDRVRVRGLIFPDGATADVPVDLQ